MLSKRHEILLTAFVDGELSRREKRHAIRLLRKSREARALYRKLREDAEKLRSLSTPPLPIDLSDSVLTELSRRQLRRIRRELQTEPHHVPSWLGVAMAASVLLVVGLASYWFFATTNTSPPVDGGTIVQDDRPAPSPEQIDPPVPPTPEDNPPDHQPANPGMGEPDKPDGDTPVDPEPSPAPPKPPKVQDPKPVGPIFGATPGDRHELKMVDVVPPAILNFQQLDEKETRNTLQRYLEQGTGFRLEIPCRDGTANMKLLENIAGRHDLGFIHTPLAQMRLTKSQWKTSYLLYMENVTPTELVGLLHQLQMKDKKNAKKPGDALFKDLVVSKLTSFDRKELVDLSGVDLLDNSVGPLGVDLRTPLPDQTADQLALSLTRKNGAAPRASPARDEPSRFALTFAYNIAQLAPKAEVQRYLASRQALQPGGLQVVLVFRMVDTTPTR